MANNQQMSTLTLPSELITKILTECILSDLDASADASKKEADEHGDTWRSLLACTDGVAKIALLSRATFKHAQNVLYETPAHQEYENIRQQKKEHVCLPSINETERDCQVCKDLSSLKLWLTCRKWHRDRHLTELRLCELTQQRQRAGCTLPAKILFRIFDEYICHDIHRFASACPVTQPYSAQHFNPRGTEIQRVCTQSIMNLASTSRLAFLYVTYGLRGREMLAHEAYEQAFNGLSDRSIPNNYANRTVEDRMKDLPVVAEISWQWHRHSQTEAPGKALLRLKSELERCGKRARTSSPLEQLCAFAWGVSPPRRKDRKAKLKVILSYSLGK